MSDSAVMIIPKCVLASPSRTANKLKPEGVRRVPEKSIQAEGPRIFTLCSRLGKATGTAGVVNANTQLQHTEYVSYSRVNVGRGFL